MTVLLAAAMTAWVAAILLRRGWAPPARWRRRWPPPDDAVPGVLEAVAADLRSGGSLLGAVREAAERPGPLAGDLAAVVARVEAGSTVAAALGAWRDERRALIPVAAAAGALQVAVAAGGRAAPALEGLAAALRDQRCVRDEVGALSAQARASAVVVGGAPLALLAVSAAADGRVAVALLGTPPGRACLAAGLLLQGAAGWWMRRIVRVAAP